MDMKKSIRPVPQQDLFSYMIANFAIDGGAPTWLKTPFDCPDIVINHDPTPIAMHDVRKKRVQQEGEE